MSPVERGTVRLPERSGADASFLCGLRRSFARSTGMTTRRWLGSGLLTAGVGLFVATSMAVSSARQPSSSVAMDDDDLGGAVTSTKGAEAGVWVIAETTDLPTKFAKIAVTDDQGRYLIPDLPKATYSVWVRGYGLVDSRKERAAPGRASESDRGACARCASGGASTTQRVTGSPCCVRRTRTSSPVPGRAATASRQR